MEEPPPLLRMSSAERRAFYPFFRWFVEWSRGTLSRVERRVLRNTFPEWKEMVLREFGLSPGQLGFARGCIRGLGSPSASTDEWLADLLRSTTDTVPMQ